MPRLIGKILINAPVERCFDLARSVAFHAAAARTIAGKAIGGKTAGLSEEGDSTRWQATFFGLHFRLTTRITGCSRPDRFADVMTRGLFKTFSHHYRFSREDGRTLLEDEFEFESPFGILGRIFDRWVLQKTMQHAQTERLEAIKSALESGEGDHYLNT